MSNKFSPNSSHSLRLSDYSTQQEFTARHIGPSPKQQDLMLKELGFTSLQEMAQKILPKTILSDRKPQIGDGVSEFDLIAQLKTMMGKNKVYKSLIGMGYAGTITPAVIQRNVFENPVWYTAYTPYQAEISQGRLEALLNFQTLVRDLTAMEISNSSLLDEGTAAAEAMSMAYSIHKNEQVKSFVVSPGLHPQIIEVLKTRSEPLGLEMILEEPSQYKFQKPIFAAFVQYPNTYGFIEDYRDLTQRVHDHGALLIAGADLLSLTLLTPPGEWGADIVIGNSQRFGVPLGFGGPHAAFLATKEAHKRLMPGRLIGVSVDSKGNSALRLALQTREQHIRREKATSNICTAQVLLANMVSMYAVYHGPEGLRKIAQRTHRLAAIAAEGLKQLGFNVKGKYFFDTILIQPGTAHNTSDLIQTILQEGLKQRLNFRKVDSLTLGVALDETCCAKTVHSIWEAFAPGHGAKLSVDLIDRTLEANLWDSQFCRKSTYLTHPVFNSHHSETELLRYIHSLQNKDITLTHSMIPLGSCTMKLNATTELLPVSWPEISQLHPFVPVDQATGLIEMIHDLERQLCELTGFAAVSLQPNAGSQGEYAGLLVIRKYFETRGEKHRNICLIPSSAHGTNPASAAMAGMQVVVVKCADNGNVDIADLKAKAELHKDKLAALMITYPSTHGVFEEGISEICAVVHKNGGQVYMDGANMNALVAVSRPGEFGPDVAHMNLHKTFSIPHGGGGPGVGPIGVRAHLAPYLPSHTLVPECGPKTGITSTTSAPWGSASILPISWAYIKMMGAEGLREATLVSILSANYIAKKLESFYPVLYKGASGFVAHECILDLRALKKTSDVDVTDVAKRLMDYGFHAPTMSWPVAGTLMVEPTESESKPELDRFIEAMISIRREITQIESGKMDRHNNPLKNSPHTMKTVTKTEWTYPYSREEAAFPAPWLAANKIFPAVGRVDNAYGDRNLVCSCPPVEDYK
ncbi:MAG: aminomethyl-transferring glycine dehydrogenase [Bdellovibrionaceae bacterium]|nr:aminomethyl-transferring glycine dehydrogenase [Pseudobdellovibrionaceae bacterium]